MSLSLRVDDRETIEGSGRALRERRATCLGLVERCLRAMDEWEPKVHAWAWLDKVAATERARALDLELARGRDRGPLHGIPVGLKDIIDAEGMPTGAGARRWSTGPATRDAPVVARLRSAGAVILGKTVTTPYAFIDPPPTRNPWDLGRTPGGSSSGSAAAVATGMCLAAIGTQTAGSVTRPAAYCGVSSAKYRSRFDDRGPSRRGILPLAPSLDAIGVFARTVGDLELVEAVLVERPRRADRAPIPTEAPRLGRLRGFFEEMAEPSIRDAFGRALTLFEGAGAEVVEIGWPPGFENSLTAVRTIMAAEAAAFHRDRFQADPGDYPPRISDLIREGLATKAADYVDAIRLRRTLRAGLRRAIPSGRVDALVVPGATGPAPGPETTGSPAFNAPWNFIDAETRSFPIALSPDGLPMAIQLVATPSVGRSMPRAARWSEEQVRSSINPDRG